MVEPILTDVAIRDEEIIAQQHDRIAEIQRKLANVPQLWSCPDCGFSFDAEHINSDGSGYSCPDCAEARLKKRLATLEAERAALVEELQRSSIEQGTMTLREWLNVIVDQAEDIGGMRLTQYLDADKCEQQRAALVTALEELADLMDDVREGLYKPDSFTTQTARAALAAVRGDQAQHG